MTRPRRRRQRVRGVPTSEGGRNIQLEVDLPGAISEYDIASKVQAALRKAGIKEAERPTIDFKNGDGGTAYDGSVPEDLEALSNQDIGIYLSAVTRWYEYVGILLGTADMRFKTYKRQLNAVVKFLRKQLAEEREAQGEGEQGKKYLDDDAVMTNPIYIQVDAELLEAECYLSYIKRAYDAAETNRRALSKIANIREGANRGGNREQYVESRRWSSGRRKE